MEPLKKDTGVGAAGGSAIQPEFDGETEREVARHALFQSASNNALKLPNVYIKVAVLIIRWDESIDDFDGHTAEIKTLQAIFDEKFGYICSVHAITNFKKPQIDLNRAILNHIYEHDGPNNLLIFYYTGHGAQKTSGLELSASQDYEYKNGAHLSTALWTSAEEPIRNHMDGDALSILDCCMASTAGIKSGNGSPRIYQLLAASAANAPTCGPGEGSFTAALCSSLIELLNEAGGGTFHLTQLCERINTKRTMQACIPWDRLRKFQRNVKLGRIEKSTNTEKPFINEDPELSSLLLRLSFKTADLKDHHITSLAEHLPSACKLAEVPLRRIDWQAMVPTKPQMSDPPSIHCIMSCPSPKVVGISPRGTFEDDNNIAFDPRPRNLDIAVTVIHAAQRWRARTRRNQGNHCQISENSSITLTSGSGLFLVFKVFCVLFVMGSLLQRDEKTNLALCGTLVIFMLMYGPCGAIGPRRYVRQ